MAKVPPLSESSPLVPSNSFSHGGRPSGTWGGRSYPTDKIQNGFLAAYEAILAPFRDSPIRLLEIGVAAGGSCQLWSDFFRHPDARIVGLDLQVPAIDVDRNRVILEVCNQNDRARIQLLAEHFGPFDIIIDDGCHWYQESRICYEELFPYVKPGGVYIIEDWFIGYLKADTGSRGGIDGKTMVTLVRDIVHFAPRAGIGLSEVIVNPCSIAAFWKVSPDASSPSVVLRCARTDGEVIEFATATAFGKWLFRALLLPYAPYLLQLANMINRIRPTSTQGKDRVGRTQRPG